jgi:hypothetical protein
VLGFCLDERSCGFDAAKTAKVACELIVDRDKMDKKKRPQELSSREGVISFISS